MRRAVHHRRAVVALIAASAVAMVGCAPSKTDASWPAPQFAPTAAIHREAPTPLAPDAVPLNPQRARIDAIGMDARWATLQVADPLNALVEQYVRAAAEVAATSAGAALVPQAHDPGAGLGARGCERGATFAPADDVREAAGSSVAIVCDVVLAAGDVVAMRLRTVGAEGSDDAVTFLADRGSGWSGDVAALVADPSVLWRDAVEAARRGAGSLSTSVIADPGPEEAASFALALRRAVPATGSLAVPLPEGFSAPELAGLAAWRPPTQEEPAWVVFERDRIADALTPEGIAVLDASGPMTVPAAGPGAAPPPCDLVPCIAMTLDDGPSTYTPAMLDELGAHRAAATFFVLGQNASAFPDTVRRAAAEGHEIANHTWDHPDLTELSDEEIRRQLDDTAALLRRLSGQPVDVFRPPGGFVDDRVVGVAGQPAILWSVDTRDWAGPDAGDLRAFTIGEPQRGSIVLMHDIQAVTAGVFDDVLTGLSDRGFSLVTVDHLFGGDVPAGIVRQG